MLARSAVNWSANLPKKNNIFLISSDSDANAKSFGGSISMGKREHGGREIERRTDGRGQ